LAALAFKWLKPDKNNASINEP